MLVIDLVIIGILSAILFVSQVSLSFIANVELVSLLIIIYSQLYKRQALYIIYVFVILEGFMYGFGLWWINYTYIWTILYILVRIFQKERSPIFWAILSGIYGLFFGALCSIVYLFIGGLPSALAYFVSGIPFDILHCVANFIIALILYKPLYSLLASAKRYIEVKREGYHQNKIE